VIRRSVTCTPQVDGSNPLGNSTRTPNPDESTIAALVPDCGVPSAAVEKSEFCARVVHTFSWLEFGVLRFDIILDCIGLRLVSFPSFSEQVSFSYEFSKPMSVEETLKDMKETAEIRNCEKLMIQVLVAALDGRNLPYVMRLEEIPE